MQKTRNSSGNQIANVNFFTTTSSSSAPRSYRIRRNNAK